MEDSKKTTVMVVVIAACLVAAGSIIYFTFFKGTSAPTREASTKTWMICRECVHTFELDLKEYLDSMPENKDQMLSEPPAFTCEKCGQKSAYKAIECKKCKTLFESIPGDISDRCPECGYGKPVFFRGR